jgi:3-isopropylmalate dehydrogenase
MKKKIALLPGDGIGKEVTQEAVKILQAIATRFNHKFTFTEALIGAAAIDSVGDPFPPESAKLCRSSDAILLGAVGDPRFDQGHPSGMRPEQGLLRMRKELGLYANIRPVKSYPGLYNRSPLKAQILAGVDLVIFRELTGGLYFGEKKREADSASDLCFYTREEITRIAIPAFEAALQRRKKLTLVDKANVLETSRLWREVVREISGNFPGVEVDYLYVDNASMQIIQNPRQFDVILTENMFGDILSDEASVLTGSLGMLPSASIGNKVSLYEPVHGSWPEAGGRNIANPIGAILSAAMMVEYSFQLPLESAWIHRAVEEAIQAEALTTDINPSGGRSTTATGDFISDFLLHENLHSV